MGDERILGSSAFVEAVLKRADEDYDRRTLARVRSLEIGQVVSQICGFFWHWAGLYRG